MSASKDGSNPLSNPTRGVGDLEAQEELPQQNAPKDKGLEYTIPTHTKLVALAGYFLLSLALTLQSKMILGKVTGLWIACKIQVALIELSVCLSLSSDGYAYWNDVHWLLWPHAEWIH